MAFLTHRYIEKGTKHDVQGETGIRIVFGGSYCYGSLGHGGMLFGCFFKRFFRGFVGRFKRFCLQRFFGVSVVFG